MGWLDTFLGRKAALPLPQGHSGPLAGDVWMRPGEPDVSVPALILHGYARNGAAFACVQALQRAFPEPDLRAEDLDGAPLDKHPLNTLLDKPNVLMDEDMFKGYAITYAAVTGACYIYKARGKGGVGPVRELWPYHAGEIRPVAGGDAWVDHYEYDLGSGQVLPIPPADIIPWRWGVDLNQPWAGWAPLATVIREIATDNELTRYLQALIVNDAVPRGAVKLPPTTVLNDEQYRRLKQDWALRFGGSKRGSLAVLEGGADYVRFSMNLQELALDALRAVPEARIAAAFGVPPIVAGLNVGLARSTYSNYEEARKAFTEQTLVPLWKALASALTQGLAAEYGPGVRVAFDLNEVEALKENTDAKTTRTVDAYNAGVITRNEARELLGFDALPDGDELKPPPALPPAFGPGTPPPDAGKPPAPEPAKPAPALPPPPPKPPGKALRTKAAPAPDDATVEALAKELDAFLSDTYRSVAADPGGYDWEQDAAGIQALMGRLYPALLGRAYADAGKVLPVDIRFDVANPRIKDTIAELAKQVRAVSDTTRDEIRGLVDRQTAEGWSMQELAKQIRGLAEVTDGLDSSHAARRAMVISRTESATAYNHGALLAYADAGVEKVRVLDSEADEACAAADGQVWTLDEARANPIAHPNCVRAFAPYLD